MHFPMNEKWSINPSIHYSQNGSSITFSYIHDYEINQRDAHEVTSEVNLAYTKLNIPFSYNCSPKLSLNLVLIFHIWFQLIIMKLVMSQVIKI